MKGSVWGSLKCTTTLETGNKLTLEDKTLRYRYKGDKKILIGLLGMLDETLTVTECENFIVKINTVVNSFVINLPLKLSVEYKIHNHKYDYSQVEYTGANNDVIIICKTHGKFNQRPSKHINCKQACPICSNKTEQKLYDAVKPLYPTLITQFKQDWCKKTTYLPFDFCIPEHNIIIELDGAQHFIQVSNWKSPEETYENDLFKETCANENGYSVIRILQEDVFGDKYDWLSKLQTEIENIIKDDTIIHNIYMCDNDEYNNFITE
jgi:very-short-patch-repair endonuclease